MDLLERIEDTKIHLKVEWPEHPMKTTLEITVGASGELLVCEIVALLAKMLKVGKSIHDLGEQE